MNATTAAIPMEQGIAQAAEAALEKVAAARAGVANVIPLCNHSFSYLTRRRACHEC